jgi:hypothetical protein
VIVVEISDIPDRPLAVARPLGYAQPVNDLARDIPGLAWDGDLKGYVGWPDAVAAFAHALTEENLAAVVGTIQDPADRLAKGIQEGLGPSFPSGKAVRRGNGSAGSSMVTGNGFMPAALRPYQREGVEFMRLLAPESGALLAWDVGLGKGQPVSTPVLTPLGWRPIGDLAVGDFVIGSSGHPTKVTGVFPRGELDVYRVTFNDGSSTVVDGDHLWSVRSVNHQQRGELFRTKSTLELKDDLSWGRGRSAKWRIPTLTGPVQFSNAIHASELLRVDGPLLDPYLLGVLLGDGSFKYDSVTLCIGKSKSKIPRELRKVLPAEAVLTLRYEKPRGEATTYGFIGRRSGMRGSNPVLNGLRALALAGLGSPAKFVPSRYLRAAPRHRLALLQGLMDTDGEFRSKDGHCEFTSSSRDLSNAVQFLVRSLGGQCSEIRVRKAPKYRYRGKLKTGLPSHRVSIVMPRGTNPFRARGSIYRERRKYGVNRLIKSIEPAGRDDVVCIAVDAADKLYVTENFIVTHNTVGVLTAMRGMIEIDGLPRTAVVIGPSITKPIWAAESLKWHPGVFRPIVLEGTKGVEKSGYPFLRDLLASNVPGIPLVILNYDIAHAWVSTLTRFSIGVLACDEAHMLQEARSRRSRAVREIRTKARSIIMLSGTPMQTRPKDLWNVIDTMAPGRLGIGKDGKPDPWKMYRRYCDAKRETIARDTVVWNINGSSHEEELNLRLRWIMTRKSKADVLTDLPPRIRQTIQIQIPGSYVLPIWESGEKMRKDALSEALSMSGVGKAGASIDLASDRIAEGHSVLIFTHRRETAKRIFNGERREKLKGVSGLVTAPAHAALISGDVAVSERTKAIKNLRQLSGTSPVVIVATIDSVGVGMDISFCDVVIFNDLDWVPSKLLQAEGRAHRHGATGESVLIYYLIGVGTADEYIQSKVISRLDLYEKVIGGQAEARGLKEDLERMNTASEEEILADLRRAVLAGEVLPEEDGL